MLLLTMAIATIGVLSSNNCELNCSNVTCSALDCNVTKTGSFCNCCTVCLKGVNEECDDDHAPCEHTLQCVKTDGSRSGRCQSQILNSQCDPELCDSSVPVCTEDSRLVLTTHLAGACCTKPQCECDYATCEFLGNKCVNNTKRYLLRKGGNTPGMCCDQFECRQPTFHCGRVRCSIYKGLGLFTECPDDSYRPESYIPDGSCCPIYPDCQCKRWVCPPVRCKPTEKPIMIRRGTQSPGSCCDVFECVASNVSKTDQSCIFDGKIYSSGEYWNIHKCQTCWCNNGVSLCKTLECPSFENHCSWISVPDGECCPICRGCVDEFGSHRINETWVKEDCTNCTCSDKYKIECQKPLCSCDESVKSDKCCPHCPGNVLCPSMEHCNLSCQYGLKITNTGCEECACESGNVKEEVLLSTKCNDQSPCVRHCFNGFSMNTEGCYTCECKRCTSMDTCMKKCLYGYNVNGAGCPICKCRERTSEDRPHTYDEGFDMCRKNGRDYKNGEWWSDSCRQCLCVFGRVYCSALSCTRQGNDCSFPLHNFGNSLCCPSCGHSVNSDIVFCSNNNLENQYVDGEMFSNGCVDCICALGHIMCSTERCNREYLNKGFPDETLDSGYCIDCIDDKNDRHDYHSVWEENACRYCQCQLNGSISCIDLVCPEIICEGHLLYLEDECCPLCFDMRQEALCNYNDVIYYENEHFSDGLCRNCTCNSYGNVKCETHTHKPFECCPTCDEHVVYSSKVETEIIIFDTGHAFNVYYMLFASVGLIVILLLLVGKLLKRNCRAQNETLGRHCFLSNGRAESTLIHPLISRLDADWSRHSTMSSTDSNFI